MTTLSDISDIFTGGLQTALDIEAERARSNIDNMSVQQNTPLASKGDSGTLYSTGTKPAVVAAVSGISPVIWIGGGLLAVLLLVVLLRR